MSEAETNGEYEETEDVSYTPPAGGATAAVAQEHGIESREFLESVTRYDQLSERVLKIAGAILSGKLAKTNLDKYDVHEIKHLVNNDIRRAIASYPPSDSCMQGSLRNYVYEDSKIPLTEHEKNQLHDLKRVIVATLRQSQNGWLLEDVIATVKQETHQIAERQDNTQQKESILDKIKGI